MSNGLPPPQRRVTLRLAGPETKPAPMPPEALDLLLARARALGLPLHHDPQIAAVLAALRLREDVPVLLYAAAAAVLASAYDASDESAA
ncbi:flagellar biosynthesis protein [Frateuria edaphi]|uniref:flagellar biosynthesis protein n=1 Tax=Frateuria edaphi TaxID=2898793 RepID=UPI001E425633|nr:flagellar biosynthesis protein [Frateuria edaphi]UGB46380.1 flagellar biosynthesis protein [Frateuria edaphi]